MDLSAQIASELFLKDAEKRKESIKEYFGDPEYVFLETNPSCLLQDKSSLYVTDKYIIACNPLAKGYLFDRKDGTFLHEISRQGGGPDEYQWMVTAIGELNEGENLFYVDDYKGWKSIDLETNKVVEEILRPVHNPINNQKYRSIYNPFKVADNEYLGYTNNIDGKIPYRLVRFNREGEVLKEYPNYVFYEKKSIDSPFYPGYFYKYKEDIYFKQIAGNDTLYRVTKEKLLPHIIFNQDIPFSSIVEEVVSVGGESLRLTFQENEYLITNVHETDTKLFFTFTLMKSPSVSERTIYVYDKKSRRLIKSENQSGGFINDIDHLPDFFPIAFNQRNECAGLISAEEILTCIDVYPFQKRDSYLQEKIDKVREDDNPIVVIARIKKEQP